MMSARAYRRWIAAGVQELLAIVRRGNLFVRFEPVMPMMPASSRVVPSVPIGPVFAPVVRTRSGRRRSRLVSSMTSRSAGAR